MASYAPDQVTLPFKVTDDTYCIMLHPQVYDLQPLLKWAHKIIASEIKIVFEIEF